MLFLMFYTGKIDRPRSVLFVAISLFFPIDFFAGLYEIRGHLMTATFENIIHGQVPFCHIVVPQTFLNLIFNREVIFPGTIAKFAYSAGGMIVIWVAASVAIGRGFCSWTCFNGDWEEGFSRFARRARVKRISPKWRLVPFAVLTAVVLTSVALATSTYCWWLCPFKAVSEFVEVDSFVTWIQTGLFIALFAGLVVVLPLLTKKRFQCLSFCPVGAFQSLVDRVNVFDIRIVTEKCTSCKKCLRACPMNSIDEKALAKGTTGSTCVKCGRCIDACPQKAIVWHLKGTPVGKYSGLAKVCFVYLAFTILAAMGGGMISSGLQRILHLVSTGSILC
jgi:ferredoxin-type protein NapH